MREVFWFLMAIGGCVLIGIIICKNTYDTEISYGQISVESKKQCESTLPRNQECEVIITAQPKKEITK